MLNDKQSNFGAKCRLRVNSRLAWFSLLVSGIFVDSCTTDAESWSE